MTSVNILERYTNKEVLKEVIIYKSQMNLSLNEWRDKSMKEVKYERRGF